MCANKEARTKYTCVIRNSEVRKEKNRCIETQKLFLFLGTSNIRENAPPTPPHETTRS